MKCITGHQTADRMKWMLDNSLIIPIRNFTADEFRCKCGCGLVNIQDYHLINMQAFRNILARKYKKQIRIIINSGCRCEKHNKAVGGVKNSRHLMKHGDACDIYSPDLDIQKLWVTASDSCLFSTVVFYVDSGFLHVDSRPGRYGKRWKVSA